MDLDGIVAPRGKGPSPIVRSALTTPPGATGNHAAAHYVAQELAYAQARAATDDLASRWTPAMEKLARHAMKKATRLAWQYEAIADAARRLNDRLSILSGVLGALVGTGSLVGAATPVSANPAIGIGSASWPTAVSVIIGYAISVIAVLVTNWRLSEISSKGVTAKVGLLNTAREIRWQLAQPAADRADAYEFVYAREAEIAHILAAAPPREDWVRENYQRGVVGGTAADEDVLDETPPATPPAIAHTAIELPLVAESATPLRPAAELIQRATELFPRATELVLRAVERSGEQAGERSGEQTVDGAEPSGDLAAGQPSMPAGQPSMPAGQLSMPAGQPSMHAGQLSARVTTPSLLQTDPLRALALLQGAFDAARGR